MTAFIMTICSSVHSQTGTPKETINAINAIVAKTINYRVQDGKREFNTQHYDFFIKNDSVGYHKKIILTFETSSGTLEDKGMFSPADIMDIDVRKMKKNVEFKILFEGSKVIGTSKINQNKAENDTIDNITIFTTPNDVDALKQLFMRLKKLYTR